MRERWVIEIEGRVHVLESEKEAARLFREAVERGAKRVVVRREVEYSTLDRVKLKLSQILRKLRRPKPVEVGLSEIEPLLEEEDLEEEEEELLGDVL